MTYDEVLLNVDGMAFEKIKRHSCNKLRRKCMNDEAALIQWNMAAQKKHVKNILKTHSCLNLECFLTVKCHQRSTNVKEGIVLFV